MKITFLTPPYNIIQSGYGSKSKINYGNLPPLGILYMTGELRKQGHEVQLIDAAAASISYDEILQRIKDFGTGIIGVSTMSPSAPAAYDMIRFMRKKIDLPIMLGGVHANIFKEKILDEIHEVDVVCIGEGERTVVELVQFFESGENIRRREDIKGICYRNKNGEVCLTESRPLLMELDTLAFPARDIIDNSLYRLLPLSFKREPVTSMITSRGCPYGKCTYCFESGNKAFKYRRHSPEYVIREIEETIVPNGIREIAFWDDYFLLGTNWLNRFCELVEKYDLSWSCYGYPRTVTREMLARIKKAGCWSVFYGFESGDQKLLDVINKGITLEHSRNAAKWTHEAGIDTRASFMLALPGETPELAEKTINFAIELNCTVTQFLPTFPERGTKLYEMALKEGEVVEYKGRMKAAYIPKGYKNAEEVEKMVRKAYKRFYMRLGFLMKHIRRIKSWNDIVNYFNALKFFLGFFK